MLNVKAASFFHIIFCDLGVRSARLKFVIRSLKPVRSRNRTIVPTPYFFRRIVMAIPVIIGSGAGRRFAWNLSANVGVSSPNQADDVQLVQLGDACAQYGSNFDAATRAIFAAVMPGAPYTGQEKSSCASIFRALISVPKSRHAPRCHARILPSKTA